MSERTVHVLLIEDNPIDARLIREILSRVGKYESAPTRFHVEWAECLSVGLERLVAEKSDVILLDLVLPDSQGFETFIRVAEQAPNTPIVVLSGLDDEALATQAVREGAQDYLVKGRVDTQLLVRAIRYAIERKRVEEALRHERDKVISILDAIPDGVYIVNQRYEIEYINPTLSETFGPVDERRCYEYFHGRTSVCPWCGSEEVWTGKTVRSEWTSRKDQRTYDLVDTPLRNPDGSLSQLRIFRDITERVQAKEEIQRRNEQLVTLNAISATVGQSLDLGQILSDALDLLLRLRLLGSRARAAIFLQDDLSGELKLAAHRGNRDAFPCFADPSSRQRRLCGIAAQRGEMVRSTEEQPDGQRPEQTNEEQILCLPLKIRGNVLGVLALCLPKDQTITDSDLVLLSSISEQIAIAVENSRLFAAVAQGKQEWETTFDTITDGISIHSKDLRIQQANRALTRLLNRPFVEIIGQRCYELLHDASQPPENCPLQEVLSSGRPTRVEQIETVLEGIFQCSVYPLRDDGGSIRGGVHILRDVTASRQAQEEVRRRNEELVALNAVAATIGQSLDLDRILPATLEILLDATGLDGGTIQLIDERAKTLTLAAAHGLPPEMIPQRDSLPLGEGLAGQVAREGQPILAGDPLSLAAGDVEQGIGREMNTLAAIPITSQDRVLGVLSLFGRPRRQLTPQEIQVITSVAHQIGVAIENVRLAEDASEIELLREVDRLRSELIANVSHELRTPLGLIKILCTTLLREEIELDAETQTEFLQEIDEETDKLEDIVSHLLDLSQMEHDRLALDKQPTDLTLLTRRVIDALQVHSEQHRLVQEFPPTPLVATIDPKRIEQVLRNLLANALKYSPQGGMITVAGQARKGELLIQVRDQGIGIPQESLEKVFERFYRVENQVTQRAGGVGLGLTVCRGIVEAHEGRIWAESTLGEGSTISFTLPLDKEQRSI